MEQLLTLMQSDAVLLAIKYGFGGIGCTLLGAGLNHWRASVKDRLQTMACFYIEDEVLSKIPVKNENNTVHENIYCKKFKVTNTTNKDISEFKIIFQFDSSAEIIECYSHAKEGWNKQKVKINSIDKNQADAYVKNFNRGESIEYTFKVANISDNKYYVSECNCIGFKIKCKDRRKHANTNSNKSDKLLVIRH